MDYFYYHWGPFLLRTQISAKECQLLLQEGKKCRKKSNDYRHELAGHMKEEYQIKNIEGMLEWFQKYIDGYVEACKKWAPQTPLVSDQLELSQLWINYMKKNEFNPPHGHSGALSFVIYPDVPQALVKENKKFVGKSIGPGGIVWNYGEGVHEQYIDFHGHFPQSGDLFIFPATLKHWVFPFTSNVERISVSGNIKRRYIHGS